MLRAILLTAIASSAAWGQNIASNVKPTTAVRNCTTSGCHAEELNHTLLHGPVAVGACDVCHTVKDVATHAFTLKREGAGLCEYCHIDKTGREGPVTHKPVAEGSCTACHSPHGSSVRGMLRKDSVNATCQQCHPAVMNGSHAHKPAAESCTQCHQAHSASHEKLLKVDREKLCITCHASVGETIANSAHPHKPAADGHCLECHSPHASDSIAVLKKDPKTLCLECHKPMSLVISGATHAHSAVTDGKACVNCHSPHGSQHVKQLVADETAACMQCHSKPIKVDKNRTVEAVNELVASEFHKHGPINTGDCAACHAVHGGNADHLLVAPYPAGFYTNNVADAGALCFKCHDPKLLEGPVAGKQTGFRDGERNLHAVHLAPSKGQQARSCRACHTVHARGTRRWWPTA